MSLGALVQSLRDLRRRMALVVGRCLILATEDEGTLQTLQVRLGVDEVRSRVERLGVYGLASRPLPGSEGVAVSIGGERGHTVVIALEDRRYRLRSLAEGEVALYTDTGQVLHFLRDGRARLVSGGTLEVDGDLEVSGNVKAGGDVEDTKGSMQLIRDLFNVHHHGSGNPPVVPM